MDADRFPPGTPPDSDPATWGARRRRAAAHQARAKTADPRRDEGVIARHKRGEARLVGPSRWTHRERDTMILIGLELVTLTEGAKRLGTSPQNLCNLRRRHPSFPNPELWVVGVEVWRWHRLAKWYEQRRRPAAAGE